MLFISVLLFRNGFLFQTVLVHHPFDIRLRLTNVRGTTLQGRYKVVITFEAFDDKDVPRRDSVCFEIRGEVEKLKK